MENPYYYETDIDLSGLKPWELSAIEIFKKAISIIGEVYSKQRNPEYPGGNFYPHNVTIDEIEQAAEVDKSILSPYTRVKRVDNKLVAVPYYSEYKEELDKVCEHLQEASKLYKANGLEKYADYINSIVKGLKQGDNDESFIKYLQFDGDINVDLTLGAFETYQDKLLAVKRAFQASLRIRDLKEFSNLKDFVKIINAVQPVKHAVSGPRDEEVLEKIEVRIDNVIALGGWHAELLPIGSNYPNDPEIYKYGMKVLVYLNIIRYKYRNLPKLVKEVFEKEVLEGVTDEDVIASLIKLTTFHEVAESIANYKYDFYKGKLRDISDVIKELNSDMTGLKAATIHVLNGLLDAVDYKKMVITLICNGLRRYYVSRKKANGIKVYADGSMFALGYFINEGAISITETKNLSVDFQKLYSSISNLTVILNEIMVNGDYNRAKELLSSYSAKSTMPVFDDRIKKYFG